MDINITKSGKAALTVHVDTKDKKLTDGLPKQLDGYTVKYVYTGPIRKQVLRKP